MSKESIALLFFSRTFGDEFRAKDLGLSKDAFKSFYYNQVNRTLSIAYQSGLQVFEHYSDIQKGSSFGEKLSHALSSIKRNGFEQVIVIGNDTPLLTLDHLENTVNGLLKGQSILGKDQHKGVWIMGFDLEEDLILKIEDVNWHTSHVYEELRQFLPNVISLCESIDLNHFKDLRLLLKSNELVRSIKRFLRSLRSTMNIEGVLIEFEPRKSSFSFINRGPPELISSQSNNQFK